MCRCRNKRKQVTELWNRGPLRSVLLCKPQTLNLAGWSTEAEGRSERHNRVCSGQPILTTLPPSWGWLPVLPGSFSCVWSQRSQRLSLACEGLEKCCSNQGASGERGEEVSGGSWNGNQALQPLFPRDREAYELSGRCVIQGTSRWTPRSQRLLPNLAFHSKIKKQSRALMLSLQPGFLSCTHIFFPSLTRTYGQ